MIVRGNFWIILLLGVALASACQETTAPDQSTSQGLLKAASGPAVTTTSNIKIPLNILVFVPCADGGAGEFVELTGNLHILSHTTVNGNRFNVMSHFQPQGISGVGQSTGDRYQGTGVTQERFGGSFVNGQFSDTFINNFRIIGQGPGNNFLVHQTFHLTVNANGEITTFVDNFKSDCK
jgi:hypothetical protein